MAPICPPPSPGTWRLPTSGILPLLAVGAQDGPGRGGQRLQGGRGQHLLRPELGQLGKALLEVHLRQDPAGKQAGSLPLPLPAAAPSPSNPHAPPGPPAHAHLSTESKVFFRGGGRTFTFLPALAASLRSGVSPAALPLPPSLLPLLLPGAGAGARAGLGGVGGSPRLSRLSPGTRQSEDELGNLLAWGVGGEGDGEHWGQTHQGKTQKQGSQKRILTTEMGQDPAVQTSPRRAHKGTDKTGRGQRGGTEGGTGAKPGSAGHPRPAGHSPWSPGPWCWSAPQQVGAVGDCSGLWESRSRGAVEGLVLLAAPQALTRMLGAHGLGQAPRVAGVQGLASQGHQPRRSPRECWRWPPSLSGEP